MQTYNYLKLNIQSLPDKYLTRGKKIKLLKRPYARTTWH